MNYIFSFNVMRLIIFKADNYYCFSNVVKATVWNICPAHKVCHTDVDKLHNIKKVVRPGTK